jgi:tetratricopeptide (TPR) repeat protein
MVMWNERKAQVLDAETGRPVSLALWHTRGVADAALNADGRYVLTLAGDVGGSQDREARVWDTTTGQVISPALPATRQGALSPDGRRVLLINGNRAWVWQLTPDPRPVEDLVALAQCLSGQRFDASDRLTALEADAFMKTWPNLRGKYPADFAVSPTAERLPWHRHQAEDCLQAQEWLAALWHLDRLLAAEPASATLWLRRGDALVALGQAEQAVAAYDKAVPHAEDWKPWYGRGTAYAQQGRWDEAGADLSRAVTFPQAPLTAWRAHTRLRLRLGDLPGYRDACAQVLERFGIAYDSREVFLDGLGVLAPECVPQLKELAALAEKYDYTALGRAISGRLLYRVGRFADAAQALNNRLRQTTVVTNKELDTLFLAMAHQQLGHPEEARQWLEKACAEYRQASAQPAARDLTRAWEQQVDWHLLHREAEALIEGKSAEPKP